MVKHQAEKEEKEEEAAGFLQASAGFIRSLLIEAHSNTATNRPRYARARPPTSLSSQFLSPRRRQTWERH